jgi:sarcosine oxidase subunit beta
MPSDEHADVVIVGGGAVGASTAYHLTELGIRDVVVIERDQLGSGSTGKAVGGVRLQFGDEVNIRTCRRAIAELERFPEMMAACGVDVDIELRRHGYLILLDSADDLAHFRAALAVQHALGVPSRELTPAEAGAMVPQLHLDGLVAATYCPADGRLVPEALVRGYAGAAAARGVRVRQGCAVTGIRASAGAITAVETTAGTIATDTVVCAAGTWSNEVSADVGLELPVRGEVHWVCFCDDDGGLADTLPLVSDFGSGFYVTREEHGLLFGGRSGAIEDLAEPAIRRLPLMAELAVRSSWWGYYDMSPDHNAIVGAAPAVPRFFFATGFSGHGVMQSPAIGEHLAELVAGRAPTLDLQGFALERFAGGVPAAERFVL